VLALLQKKGSSAVPAICLKAKVSFLRSPARRWKANVENFFGASPMLKVRKLRFPFFLGNVFSGGTLKVSY
jgi:hypothetical protein